MEGTHQIADLEFDLALPLAIFGPAGLQEWSRLANRHDHGRQGEPHRLGDRRRGDNRLHGFEGDTGAAVFSGGGPCDAMNPVRRFQTRIARTDICTSLLTGRSMRFCSERRREFLPKAHAIVFETNTVVAQLKEMSQASRGSFTLACMSTMSTRLLPVLMRKYADRHPRNRIRLLDLTSNDVREAVLHRKAEVGIAIHGEAHSDLNERFLFDDVLALYCHESHPLAKQPRRPWRALKGADLIIVRGFTATRLLIEYHLLSNGVSTGDAYEVQYHSTAVNLVEAGVGCAVLPWSVLGASSRPHMTRIQLVEPVVHRRVMLFTHRNASLSPAAQAFLDLVNVLFKGRMHSNRAVR